MNQPVEYAVAVDAFLAAAALGTGSRRVYQIALTTWAWALVDRTPPAGKDRRGAAPPAVPLALLGAEDAAARLGRAVTTRTAAVGVRTVAREVSALTAAVTWWRAQGWLTGDPTAGLRALTGAVPRDRAPRLDAGQIRAVLALPVPLREKALWHLLHETGAAVDRVLALDVDDLDLAARRTREHGRPPLRWADGSAGLLPILVLGRVRGPLFATSRGRLSYRRAAEVFTAATRPLDPLGRGWTLHLLTAAERP